MWELLKNSLGEKNKGNIGRIFCLFGEEKSIEDIFFPFSNKQPVRSSDF